ncbi:MAG: hypothetical protein HY710_07990, partial [Candidatus Latescibacteria bacterium]|nr:hypothetical protein [Candidatus Latescibacterota bacterium]
VLYAGLFGKTLTNLIPGAHARYLLPSIVLFGLLVSCFLDGRVEPGNREVGWILLAALAVQAGLVSVALWSDKGHSGMMMLRNLASFRLSALISEWMPFFLAGGFWVTERFLGRWHTGLVRVRLAALCVGCLMLTPAWALAEPWQMLFTPAQWRMVDWTAIPLVSPYGPWARAHLPRSAVLLVDDDRRWIIPRQILPVDSPLLQDLYRSDRPLMHKLERLAELGVTHIVTKGERGQPLPLRTDWVAGRLAWPFLQEQESEHYFKQMYQGPPVPYAQDPLGWNESETYLYEIVYPPRLKKLVESPLPRPWLYGYATVGSLNP